MDFLSRFMMINTLALGAALALLAWNWRRTRNEPSAHNQAYLSKQRGTPSVKEIEKRAEKVMSNAKKLVSQGEVSGAELESLKKHQEAFYAHYYAANVYLSQDSQSSFKAYLNELNLAEEDLAAMEAALRDHLISPPSPSFAHSHS